MSADRNTFEIRNLPYYFVTEPTFYIDTQRGQLIYGYNAVDALTIEGELQVTRSYVFLGNMHPGDIISSEKENEKEDTADFPLVAISSFDTSLPKDRTERMVVLREIADNLPHGGYYLTRGKRDFDTKECELIFGSPVYTTQVFVEGETTISNVYIFKKYDKLRRSS